VTAVGSGRPGTVNWLLAVLMRLEVDGHGDAEVYVHEPDYRACFKVTGVDVIDDRDNEYGINGRVGIR
jgi:hypothetical protein